ncbi:hypothetical protein EI613_03105 [Azospirillum sp. 412522]|nr:hypothetical protein [Azospirillum sp. 412522]MBY6260912.1 hypothetical protein [Azospirillum sp. 412522]
MSFDSTCFPLVWVTFEQGPEHDHDKDFQAFEANLRRGEPFVLLTDSTPDEDHEHSQEGKKRNALWMKKHKAELRNLVLAMIVIEPSAAKRLAFKAFGVAFAKFWGFPMRIASSREEAMEIAGTLLSVRTGSAAV